MNKCFGFPFDRVESLNEDYLIATYLVYGMEYSNALSKAGNFAIGQTVGTWIKLPGITDEMVEKYQARVIGLYEISGNELQFILRVAFPMVNFASSFAMMLTALVGNDVSTALRTKLIDIELTKGAASLIRGPKDPIKKLRDITEVKDRPIILNMIKPCTGFTAKEGSKLFHQVALGGVDLIKDDELLGSPSYNQAFERVTEYNKAAKSAYEVTGKHTTYMVNITDKPSKMVNNAKAAIEAGAKACLVNFAFCGLDALSEICDQFGDDLFIMGHYAGVGVMNCEKGGISNQVYIGTLPRLAGVDAIMTMFADETNAADLLDMHKTVQAQRLKMGHISEVVTAIGGGVTPLNVEKVYKSFGNDTIIGIGGAIQGHPNGATGGAKAAMSAIHAATSGISLVEMAKNCKDLQAAIEIWGGRS